MQFWVPGGGKLEFIAPLTETSFLRRDLDRRGEGFHHVTFKVRSIEHATARAVTSVTGSPDSIATRSGRRRFSIRRPPTGCSSNSPSGPIPFPLDGTLEDVLAGRVIDPT